MFQKIQDGNGVRHQQTRCVMDTPSSSSTAKVTPLLDKSVFTINFLTPKLHMTRIEMLMLNALKAQSASKKNFPAFDLAFPAQKAHILHLQGGRNTNKRSCSEKIQLRSQIDFSTAVKLNSCWHKSDFDVL